MKKQPRILIVDDTAAIHEDIGSILSTHSQASQLELHSLEDELFKGTPQFPSSPTYTIENAFQGSDAIAMVDRAEKEGNPYALIFMDIRMPPGLDGIKATKAIWERHPYIEVAIITAYSDYSWEEILKELGTSDRLLFLRKPFDSVAVKQTALAMCAKWDLHQRFRNLIGSLEERVSDRTRQLSILIHEKEDYVRAIHEELSFAETVQRFLLPHSSPNLRGFEFAARYIPTSKVGGDFYDIRLINDSTMAVLIFDVSGHGLAASLVTALGKTSFDAHLRNGNESPKAILAAVNKDIRARTPEIIFLTAFVALIDIKTLTMRFSNAGHTPAQLHRAGTDTIEDLHTPGTFLGVFEAAEFEDKEISLCAGDRVLFYTDGLIEAFSKDGKMYGIDRIQELLLQNPHASCEEISTMLLHDNNTFITGVPRGDDVCYLIMRVKDSSTD